AVILGADRLDPGDPGAARARRAVARVAAQIGAVTDRARPVAALAVVRAHRAGWAARAFRGAARLKVPLRIRRRPGELACQPGRAIDLAGAIVALLAGRFDAAAVPGARKAVAAL